MHFIMLWSTCWLSSNAGALICCKSGCVPWHWGQWTLLWLLSLGTKYPDVFPWVFRSSWGSFVKAAVLQDKLSPQIPSDLWAPCLVPFRKKFPDGLRQTPQILPPSPLDANVVLDLVTNLACKRQSPRCKCFWGWASLPLCKAGVGLSMSKAPLHFKAKGEKSGIQKIHALTCAASPFDPYSRVCAQTEWWEQSWWSQPCASTGAWQEGCASLETWLKADGERSYCSVLWVVRGNVQCIIFWDTFPENVSLS